MCIDETGSDVEQIWGRKGYCRPLDSTESIKDTFQDCPAGSTGGTGGTNGGGGESGGGPVGTGGTGASSGEGGEPAVNTGGGGQSG